MANLFACLYERPNFEGSYRWVTEDTRSLGGAGAFSVASIKVFTHTNGKPDPRDCVQLFTDHDMMGDSISLGTGAYPDLRQSNNFGPQVLSVRIYDLSSLPQVQGTPLEKSVPLIVSLYSRPNFHGERCDLVESVEDLGAIGFDNRAASFRVTLGPDFTAEWRAAFYEAHHFSGGALSASAGSTLFQPRDRVTNLEDVGMLNRIRSVQFLRDPRAIPTTPSPTTPPATTSASGTTAPTPGAAQPSTPPPSTTAPQT